MYSQILSEAGSIREENQDYYLDSPDLGLMVLADGAGPQGKEVAATAAKLIHEKVKSIYRLTLPAETERRLKSISETTASELAEQFAKQSSTASWIIVWMLGESFSYLSNGDFRLYLETANSFKNFPAKGTAKLPLSDSNIPIAEKNSIYLTSEGINLSCKELELAQLLCQKKLEAFHSAFIKCGKSYDGDDRTMIKVHFSDKDIKPFKTGDFVLSTEIDKVFTFKIWQPLAVLAGIGLSLLLAGTKVMKKFNK